MVPIESYRFRPGFLTLEPGLHSLRFEQAQDGAGAVFCTVCALPGQSEAVQFRSSRDPDKTLQGATVVVSAPVNETVYAEVQATVHLIVNVINAMPLGVMVPRLEVLRLEQAKTAVGFSGAGRKAEIEIVYDEAGASG